MAIRQTIAQQDFLHTNDTAAGHNVTIKLQWHQTRRSSRLVTAICAGKVRGRTNQFAAAQSSQSACLALIHNTRKVSNQIQFELDPVRTTAMCQALFETSQSREESDVDFEMLRTTGPGTHFKPALTSDISVIDLYMPPYTREVIRSNQ